MGEKRRASGRDGRVRSASPKSGDPAGTEAKAFCERSIMDVYISDVSAYLPNEPVRNGEIEKFLGKVERIPTKIKQIVLASNGIKSRYYAIDPETGKATHTNAELTAEAIRRLDPYPGFSPRDIECLACGTSTPDQLMPGHGPMVHGVLGTPPTEVVSNSGICLSGMGAFKYGFMNVALGLVENAVASGSDVASTFTSHRAYVDLPAQAGPSEERGSIVPFDTAFLRWMLSDGAGAVFLTGKPVKGRQSLKVDWIEHLSFAGEMETCMFAGATKEKGGAMKFWREYSSPVEAFRDGAFLIKQDIKLLAREAVRVAVEKALPRAVAKHALKASQVDWFLPHYSSEFFKMAFYEGLQQNGFEIPLNKWFTNLHYKGNTGAASIYIILEELFHSGRLKKDEQIFCFVPESGRFSMCYMMLTVVDV